jgi:hypothetical protein
MSGSVPSDGVWQEGSHFGGRNSTKGGKIIQWNIRTGGGTKS